MTCMGEVCTGRHGSVCITHLTSPHCPLYTQYWPGGPGVLANHEVLSYCLSLSEISHKRYEVKVVMKGSHINIWLTKGAKVKLDDSQSSTGSAGWENPAFGPRDSTELGSLGLVPLEEKVDELLERHQISFLVRSQASPGPGQQEKVLLQIFVPESQVEAVLVGLERCGVGAVAGTGYCLIPTAGRTLGHIYLAPHYLIPHTSLPHT